MTVEELLTAIALQQIHGVQGDCIAVDGRGVLRAGAHELPAWEAPLKPKPFLGAALAATTGVLGPVVAPKPFLGAEEP